RLSECGLGGYAWRVPARGGSRAGPRGALVHWRARRAGLPARSRAGPHPSPREHVSARAAHRGDRAPPDPAGRVSTSLTRRNSAQARRGILPLEPAVEALTLQLVQYARIDEAN